MSSGNDGYQKKNLKPDFASAQKKQGERPRRRRDDAAVEENKMLWLITFTDIIGLMLTFFVMMFAMSEPEQKPFQEMAAALSSELNAFNGKASSAGPEDSIDMGKIDFGHALDVTYLKALINEVINKDPVLKENSTLETENGHLVLTMPQDLLFEPGQAVVKQNSTRLLFTFGGAFSRMKNKIELVGRAIPRTVNPAEAGSYDSDWELSLSRAVAAAAALDKVGYNDPVTVRGASSGRYQELGNITDENARQDLSRRVDIVIMNHDGKARKVFTDESLP